MDTALNIQIGNFVSEGNWILQSFRSEVEQLKTPSVIVAKDLLVEGAGEFAGELFGTKKAKRYGKKVTEAFFAKNTNDNRQAIMTKYGGILDRWESEVVNFLQQVSTSTPGIIAPGNSEQLMLRVRRADRYNKLETRARHIVAELRLMQSAGLTYNSNLPRAISKPNHVEQSPDSTKILKNLEKALRVFIERELGNVSKDWWQRVPSDIRKFTENRKSRSEVMWPWYPPTSTNIVDYLDFSDYRKIILDPGNWKEVFSKFFKNSSFIETRLVELDPIRNDIAHSRQLTKLASDKLRIYSAELQNCMKSA
jgi:hypothetical protein